MVMRSLSKTIPLFLTVAWAACAIPIWAAVYTTVDFPGAVYTMVTGGPSPQGEVVGTYIDAAQQVHGFVRSTKGVFTSIDFPDAANTQINGWVNPKGDIVGQYTDRNNRTHGFLLHQGVFKTVDYPGATYTALAGINPQESVIGTYCVLAQCGAFTIIRGIVAPLTAPGVVITGGASISPTGTTVSFCTIANVRKLCLIDNGALTVLSFPGSLWTSPGAGNAANDIVGGYRDPQSGTHAFIWTGGTYTQLDFPGSILTYAGGVNPEKYVVGLYYDTHGNGHGFIAHP